MTDALATLGRFGVFTAVFVLATVRNPPPISRTIEEAYRIGVRSLPILLVIAVFVGSNLTIQGYYALAPLGGSNRVGEFVALAGVREMAPIMVGAMVAAKAGTEMASQIAVMRIREQIDALYVMAVDPHWFLITPRFFGIILVLPALNAICVFVLMFAAWFVAVVQLHLNGAEFLVLAAHTTTGAELLFTLVKSEVFGAVICIVSCFYGFFSRPGPSGVGDATNAAVVVSSIGCAIANYLLSDLMYG